MNPKELELRLQRIAQLMGWNVVMQMHHGELAGFAIGNAEYLRDHHGVDFAQGVKRPALQLVE